MDISIFESLLEQWVTVSLLIVFVWFVLNKTAKTQEELVKMLRTQGEAQENIVKMLKDQLKLTDKLINKIDLRITRK